jgi:outer membrane protein assembly factor BamB
VGLYCFTLDGEPVWSRPFEAHDTNYGWGTSISPVVHDGKVYIVNDNEESSYMLALDAKTGQELWRIPRDEKTNYSTPFVWENDVRTEIVVSAIGYARSYDLDGKQLWQIKGRSILAIPVPFERFGNLYLTSGHVAWGENPMYVVKPGAEGDLSPSDEKDAQLSPHLAWYQPKAGPYHPTPIIVGEQIYVLYDRGLMASFNAKTGEPVYPRKRIPDGRAFTSSPWTYGGKIFCLNEDGVTFAIQTGPEFEVLYTNSLLEDDMCMATPVIVGDKLLIRSSERLYCIAAGAEPTAVGSK